MSMTRDMVIAMLGISRLALFDRSGVDFFPASNEAASRSFWIPALAAPIFLFVLLQNLPPFLAEIPASMIYSVVGLGMIITLSGYYLAAYTVCKAIDKKPLYARYVTINNWATVLYMVVLAPSMVVNGFGIGEMDTRQFFDQICTLVMLVYMWFIARHALHLGGLGAVGMVVLFNLIYFVAMIGVSVIMIQAAGGQEHVQMMLESMQGATEGLGEAAVETPTALESGGVY